MGFLAPWFLAGLAAVGLPYYLHLLRRHKSTPRPFSSLMFFERRVQSSLQHRRLKYRLLFALRALFFALLALAFARPFFDSTRIASAHSGRVIALLIDNSFSMRQGDRFARAQQDAASVVNGMSASDRAQAVAFGGPARLLTNLTGDRPALQAAIRGLQPGDEASSFAEAARVVRSLSQSSRSPVEAHLFSDMQKTSAPANFSDLRLPEGARLILHPAVDQTVPNFAVENVLAPHRLFTPKSGRVQATLVSYSAQDAALQATLLLNDRPVETKPAQLPAGGRATVDFTGFDAPFGFTRGEVRIASADRFPEDDHFYFAVERSDPAPALFIHDPNDTRSALYFQTALAAVNQPAFAVSSVTYAQAAGTNLDRFAFVAISDPESAPGLNEAIRKYVQRGGGALFLLGHRGSRPVARAGDTSYVAQVDTTHPVLRSTPRWDGIRFFRTAAVQPANTKVLLRLDDGSPLLLEETLGEGRALVFASSLDNLDNDLPVSPLFVPFMQRVTDYLGRAETATGNYTAGAFYDLRFGEAAKSAAVTASPIEVTGPSGERVLSLAESTRVRAIPLDRQGFYDVRRQNGKHELAAVNPDRRESDLTPLAPETLALWRNTGTTAENAAASAEPADRKNQLWWYVLLVALALALAESIIGNRQLDVKEGVS